MTYILHVDILTIIITTGQLDLNTKQDTKIITV
jgi:hypothetical protein